MWRDFDGNSSEAGLCLAKESPLPAAGLPSPELTGWCLPLIVVVVVAFARAWSKPRVLPHTKYLEDGGTISDDAVNRLSSTLGTLSIGSTGPAHHSWLNHVTELNLMTNQHMPPVSSTRAWSSSEFLRRSRLPVSCQREQSNLTESTAALSLGHETVPAYCQLDSRPHDITSESMMSLSEEVTQMDWEDQDGLTSTSHPVLVHDGPKEVTMPLRQSISCSSKRKRRKCMKWLLCCIVLSILIAASSFYSTPSSPLTAHILSLSSSCLP